jgi:hypothetical protein
MITADEESLFRTMQESISGAPRGRQTYGSEDGEHCPECSHAWALEGPAHFTDCRHFSLDDDRDEEVPVRLLVMRRKNGHW